MKRHHWVDAKGPTGESKVSKYMPHLAIFSVISGRLSFTVS